MRLLVTLTFYFLATVCFGQSSIIEELRKQLGGTLSDSATVMVKTQLARELVYIDNAEAYELVQEAINLASEEGLELEGAYAMRILGAVMREYGFYLKGSEVLLDAKAIFEEYDDQLGVANCYLSLANYYNYLSDQKLAIETERKARIIFEKLQNRERLGVIYNNIGRTFYDVGNYDSAAHYCKASIEVNRAINNLPLIQSNYRNLGLVFLANKQLDSAERAFKRVMDLHWSQGEYSNKWATAEACLGLAKVAIKKGNHQEVAEYLQMAKLICAEYGYLDILKEVVQTSFSYNKSIENYNHIDELWTTYQTLTDSLLEVERDNKKYIVDWYEERIQKDSEIADFTIRLGKQKIQIVVLALLVLLALVILVMFVVNNRREKRINKVLNEQKVELEKLNQTKSKLFSIVAHDFISPLSNVYSFSRLLSEDIHMSEEDKSLAIKELNQSVENTIDLTKNLLTWARNQMDGEIFNPVKMDLGNLINMVVKSISSQASAKKIGLAVDCPKGVIIEADPSHLEVVFRNLLSNAIKFSHPDQTIHVKVERLSHEVQVDFIDEGIGMSPDVKDKLFELNEYADVRGTAGEKGTGLGMIICKEFVEKNQGRIKLSSEEGKGTTVQLAFPSV